MYKQHKHLSSKPQTHFLAQTIPLCEVIPFVLPHTVSNEHVWSCCGFKDGKTLLSTIHQTSPLVKLGETALWGEPCFQPLGHFVVWDHTRTIMAYWPSSVSMGTEKPFLPLLRLESYLLLFYFGKAHADYLEACCCYSNSFYHSLNIYLWYHYL